MIRGPAAGILLALLTVVLLACTSTEQTLDPNAIAVSEGAGSGGSAGAVGQGKAGAASLQKMASAAAAARIEIAPVVGAAPSASQPLTDELKARASARGLGIADAGAGPATHIIKGYFSAITEGPGTTVIYVWDVLDPAGNRLHRIQGQQPTHGRGEGWAAVPASAMQAIADQTVDQLLAWLAVGSG